MDTIKKPIIPEDIKPNWLSVVRSAQASVSKSGNQGLAVVSLTVLIDKNGNPVFWVEPSVRKIEPKSKTKDQLAALLQGIAL